MKEKERGGVYAHSNVILDQSWTPSLGTQGTFGLVTRGCLELPSVFFFAV